ncbi:hypothetical protein [Metabacillus fastidiosus]|uniref:hypothetical protein n=1 Tax=Metabacillus fastidiosus TaxID=1458 RepID=UPI003D278E60
MNYQFEKNKLYAYLGKGLAESLKAHNAYVAGGTITSLFCNREINDIDVYFRSEEDIISFMSEIWEDQKWIVTQTSKATLLVYDKVQLQLIHFDYFKNPQDIFDTFDFSSCMGCFDFKTEEFILHDDFLKHNSQRLLKFNSLTAFPIVSLLRVQKYQDKGYYISKPEFIRIVLTCMDLEISTYEELKDQLGGMYGINYDKLFEDVEEEEFDLQVAIDKIANITLDESYFEEPTPVEFDDLESILSNISTKPKQILEINNKLYKIGFDGLLSEINEKPDNHELLNTYEYFYKNKFYKFVKKDNEEYFSFYDKKFEYKIGEIVEAKESNNSYYSHGGKLYFNEKIDIDSSPYKNHTDAVLIEVEVKPEDFVGIDGHVLAKKCLVLREVPKDEWEKFNGIEKNEEKAVSNVVEDGFDECWA